ncbi:YbaB/EbfC family nucleoid-associated protein [Streptomyces sp. NPDC056707]|uniref:YbaB/EbfC family nucleoid-associated protein n=1 Tax=Streptomyces sp. NPDC056707 TaxID=3345919 RepID=UPI0036ABA375
MTNYEDLIARAQQDLENIREETVAVQERLASSSFTTTSKDRSVEVTVGAQGELTGLRFLERKYRTMAAPQLAASVLEATTRARAQAAERVIEMVRPLTEISSAFSDVPNAGTDWGSIFGELLQETRGAVPRPAAADKRLRDEIVDDPHDVTDN